MTILIALAHEDFVFLASDSLRRDLLHTNVKNTVSKMRISGSNGLIMAGRNMDRNKFADALIECRDAGEPFIDAANRLAPGLFAEKLTLLQKLPVSEREQTVMSVYGEAHDHGCTAFVHQVGHPCAWAFSFKGVFVSEMVISQNSIARAVRFAFSTGRIPLDVWAQSVVADAIVHMSHAVDFPCDIALLQPRREPISGRITLSSAAAPEFEVPISPQDLFYQPGSVQNF